MGTQANFAGLRNIPLEQNSFVCPGLTVAETHVHGVQHRVGALGRTLSAAGLLPWTKAR